MALQDVRRNDRYDTNWRAGVAAVGAGRWGEAERGFQRAVQASPGAHAAWLYLARSQLQLGKLDSAVAAARRALALKAGDAVTAMLLGECLTRRHRHAEAAEVLEAALTANAPTPDLLSAAGSALLLAQRPQEAIARLIQASMLSPADALLHYRLGLAFKRLGAESQASICFRTALSVDHDGAIAPLALPLLVSSSQQSCDWTELERDGAALLALLDGASVERGGEISPFSLLALPSSRAQQRRAGALHTRHLLQGVSPSLPPPGPRRPGRVRVGYLSSDFHNHATALLMVGMLECRDRERFEVYAYTHSAADGSALQQRLLAACDHVVDVARLSDAEVAERMRRDGLDIGIDLKGHTRGTRMTVFARRPAPVQVSFLGYPGSTGADFLDYVIGDPVVTPLEHAADYSECIAQMPHCYQPNDQRRALPPAPPRAALGLPEDALVLCCFNQSYKITPELLALWARMLHELPRAVLWLLAWNADGQRRLLAALEALGIGAERVVFAERLPVDQHIARLRAADLFLDTWPYNAHTTASEALWAAVPVLTVPGETFASRVAASLVTACGLPELACADAEAYVRTAVELGRSPERLQALRCHLDARRAGLPLFDTERYTRDYEALLLRMHERRLQGLAPAALPAA